MDKWRTVTYGHLRQGGHWTFGPSPLTVIMPTTVILRHSDFDPNDPCINNLYYLLPSWSHRYCMWPCVMQAGVLKLVARAGFRLVLLTSFTWAREGTRRKKGVRVKIISCQPQITEKVEMRLPCCQKSVYIWNRSTRFLIPCPWGSGKGARSKFPRS